MIVTFAMSNLSFVSTNTPFSGSVGQEIFYIRTLVDFCGFAILYAQQEQARVLRRIRNSRRSTRSWKASIRNTCNRRKISNR